LSRCRSPSEGHQICLHSKAQQHSDNGIDGSRHECDWALFDHPSWEHDGLPTERRFDFWKETKPHIAEPQRPIILKEFPGEIAYVASEWRGQNGQCLILLESYH
jgi:hypothetical protein